MPLYRQAGLLRRFGGDISSNTIAASIVRAGLASQPVINLMRDALLDAEVILCDETTFQVLKEKGRKPQTKSYLWCVSRTQARACDAVSKMGVGLPKPACRGRLQTARCCCVQKTWW